MSTLISDILWYASLTATLVVIVEAAVGFAAITVSPFLIYICNTYLVSGPCIQNLSKWFGWIYYIKSILLQIQQNQEIVCLKVIGLSLLIHLTTSSCCLFDFIRLDKVSNSLFSAFLFPITLVNVTSPASDLLSITFLLLPTKFSTLNKICVSDDWKGVSFGKTLKFCSELKGVISNVTLLFTDTSSREFPMSSWLVNWFEMLICLFLLTQSSYKIRFIFLFWNW